MSCHFLFPGLAGAVALAGAHFGSGVGDVWLNELNCVGDEANVLECGHLGFGVHDCVRYNQDVGVVCQGNHELIFSIPLKFIILKYRKIENSTFLL